MTTVLKPIKGRVIRVVRLDTCGNAATGAAGVAGTVTSDAFITASLTPEYEAGVEFVQKNANGDLCVNEKDPDRLKRMSVKLNMCSIDPAAVELMTGSRLITRSADNVGNAMNADANNSAFAIEIWSNLAGAACTTGGAALWFMWLIPWVQNCKVNAITIDNTPISMEIEGTSKVNPNYGLGRAGLWSPAIGATEHWAYQSTTTAPPTSVPGYTQTP